MTNDLLEAAHASKYSLNAFLFVQRGLDFTVRDLHGEPKSSQHTASRHVTGHQLCQGLRDYAIDQYGLMARSVLKRWEIHGCEDFGAIVFALIDAGLMQKNDADSIEDFTGVYDFSKAFSPTLQLSKIP